MFIGIRWFDHDFAIGKTYITPRLRVINVGSLEAFGKWVALLNFTVGNFLSHFTVLPWISLFSYEHIYVPQYSLEELKNDKEKEEELQKAVKRLYGGKRNRLNILFFFNFFW